MKQTNHPLRIENLNFSYGTKEVLKDVSFDVPKGTFCGLLGPNGAGKSTLFNLLTGLLPAPKNHIHIAGHDIQNQPLQALKHIGVVFQQSTLELDMSVAQNMRYFAALRGMAGKAIEERITQCLTLVNMNERRDEKTRALNGGHKRRMEIARALIHQPQILLLDEATAGLDISARRSIVKDVHKLTKEGISVLWATHLVDELWPEDNVIILNHGQIKAKAQVQTLTTQSTLMRKFLEITDPELLSQL